MGKDIFISYRREGGEHLALLIYHQLRYDGYSVFLDVESLRKGKFDEALFERIREATDFILILPPKALDRCANSDDWVRQEIEFALREKKNIIPIMMEGFDSWPADLPETMMAVSKFNGLKNHQGYFGDMMRKLEKGFLESSPRMQSGPAESAEEDIEILEKCQHCGSDNIVCEDPFPNHLYWLRILRRAIHWWFCLTPLAFFLIMLLGSASAGESQSLQVLGLRLDFLLQNPVVQSIDFGPLSPMHFAATMAADRKQSISVFRNPGDTGKRNHQPLRNRDLQTLCRKKKNPGLHGIASRIPQQKRSKLCRFYVICHDNRHTDFLLQHAGKYGLHRRCQG